MSLEVTSIVTNIGKRHIASNLINGSAIKVTHYQLGTGGVDPFSGSIIAPTPYADHLNIPLGGMVSITNSDIIGHCPIWTVEVGPGVQGPLSEIGLWAQEVESIDPIGNALTFVPGSFFLFTYGTYGKHDIISSETITFIINVQF